MFTSLEHRRVNAAALSIYEIQSVQNGPLCFQRNRLPVWIEHQVLKESKSCTMSSVHNNRTYKNKLKKKKRRTRPVKRP
ncbi:hypothetical protein JOB18_005131 [Solea senegalensis]|uniref:Uncharacterized protein n=1 Tax=Solea senegalensis TaxID=28829 RepID=A0AAV6PGY2_SOLSE|nr:hypothetical protein JOB18_005131 [Solea senegalensis]